MIFPRSLQQAMVLLVDLIAWPVNRAIDAMDFSDIGDDEFSCAGCGATPGSRDGWRFTDAAWCPKCAWLA
jgi:hypothetical protein